MVHLSHGVLDLCRHYGKKIKTKSSQNQTYVQNRTDSNQEVRKGRLKKLQTHIFHMLL